MRFLLVTAVVLICMTSGAVLTACSVEREAAPDTVNETSKVQIEIDTTPGQPTVDVDVHKEGAFERLGEKMDVGAQKLDKGLEKGAGKLGEAMQNAGQRMQENSEEAQRRREVEETRKPVEIDVNINTP